MDILCIAPDTDFTRGVVAHCEALDRAIDVLAGDVDEAEMLSDSSCRMVIVYADEVEDTRSRIAMLRRAARRVIYIVLLTQDWPAEAALEIGANSVLALDALLDDVALVLGNEQRFFATMDMIGDQSRDFPSLGGVIGRSAFYQLFLSGVDRASRYGEAMYLLLISLENYDELFEIGGDYVADYAVAALSKRLTEVRRQSDIIGQIDKHVYGLLLQRPSYETEPLEAAERFVSVLSESLDVAEGAPVPVMIRVSLVSIPSGSQMHDTLITLEKP